MTQNEVPHLKLSVGHPPSSGASDFSILTTPPRSNGTLSQTGFPFRRATIPQKDEELSIRMMEMLNENQELRGNLQESTQAMKDAFAQIQKWKADSESSRKEMLNKCEASVQVVTRFKHMLQERDTQIAQLKLEIQQLKLDVITQDPVAINNELRQKNSELRGLRNHIEELELGSSHNKEQLDQMAVYKESLKKELQELRLNRDKINMEIATFKAEQEVHRRARIRAEESAQQLREQVDRLREENRIIRQHSSPGSSSAGSSAFVLVQGSPATDPKVASAIPNMQLDTTMADIDGRDPENSEEEREAWHLEKADLALKLDQKEKELSELRDQFHQVTAEMKQLQQENQEKCQHLHQQISQLQHHLTDAKESQSHNSHQDITVLKSQVVSLMCEVSESQNKRQTIEQENQGLRERCSDLERKFSNLQRQLKTTRDEDDNLIQTLRHNVKTLEAKTQTQNNELDARSKGYEELHQTHSQLCKDYRDLYLKCEALKANAVAAPSQTSFEQEPSRDALMAKLLAASETLDTKKRLIHDLMREKTEMQSQIEMIPVHEAQLEVYKQDFETERRLKEDEQRTREDLAFQLRQVKAEKLQLQEQLSRSRGDPRLSSSPASYPGFPPPQRPQNYASQASHSSGVHEYSGRPGHFPYGHDMCDLSPRSASPFQGVTDRNVLQNTDATLENLRLQEENPIRMRAEYQDAKPPPDRSTTYECPKCKRVTSDLESLERHFVDCLDSDH